MATSFGLNWFPVIQLREVVVWLHSSCILGDMVRFLGPPFILVEYSTLWLACAGNFCFCVHFAFNIFVTGTCGENL